MSLNYVSLGAKVKAIRKHRGFTQAALAEKVNCATTHISYIESGIKCMSLPLFVEVANALNASADELLRDSLNNTVLVSNHEFSQLLTDCSEYERRVLFDVLSATKNTLRSNRSYFQIRRR